MEIEPLPWTCVQTRSGASALAVQHLARQGFIHYSPMIRKRIRRADGKVVVGSTQLFQNYVFVFVIDRWRSLKSTIGVAKLLMFGDESPAVVDQQVIENLRAKEDCEGMVVLGKPKFDRGERVQFKSGPFALECGLFDGQRDGERVAVLMTFLGTQRLVLTKEDDLVSL